MMKAILTSMKMEGEPIFYKAKTGEACYFTLCTARPSSDGTWFKPVMNGFGEITDKLKRMQQSNNGTLQGCFVDVDCTMVPYTKNGNIMISYNIKEIGFTEGIKRTSAVTGNKVQETAPAEVPAKPAPKDTEKERFMSMANMLDTDPFSMNS